MSTIRAVFENGVFRPLHCVELPERAEVEFEPRLIKGSPDMQLDGVYSILSERFESGETGIAQRHDGHQP